MGRAEIALTEKPYVIGAASAMSGNNANPARPAIRREALQTFIVVPYDSPGAVVQLTPPRCQRGKRTVSCGTAGCSSLFRR
jgi:hypothetical protein